MKRRVLRAHANKRCLRILSASNQLRTLSSTDRGYAVLCDASFLRAVLLAYWQAHAPAAWREARKRQLRKAAAAAAQPQHPQQQQLQRRFSTSTGERDSHDGQDDHGVSGAAAAAASPKRMEESAKALRLRVQSPSWTAATIARLPVQLPAQSPFDFLNALMNDAFQVNGSDAASKDQEDQEERQPRRSGAAGSRVPKTKVSTTTTTNISSSINGKKHVPFFFHCLPETVAALHRMREGTVTATTNTNTTTTVTNTAIVAVAHHDETQAKKGSCASVRDSSVSAHTDMTAAPPPPQLQRRLNETERWLAASFGDLTTSDRHINSNSNYGDNNSMHSRGGSTTAPLLFQEVPAVVVQALLSRLNLLQDPNVASALDFTRTPRGGDSPQHGEKAGRAEGQGASLPASPPPSLQSPPAQRNEGKAIADFMAFNQTCLSRGVMPTALSPEESDGWRQVQLCTMPLFTDGTTRVLGHHALKRQRKHARAQAAATTTTTAADDDADNMANKNQSSGRNAADNDKAEGVSAGRPSRPFLPRSFFVATQSHDVRGRLPPATALLRLTNNPDALWIEQRGTAYHYNTDDCDDKRGGHSNVVRPQTLTHSRATDTSSRASSSMPRRTGHPGHHNRARAAAASVVASRTPTVVAAAPQLSRADVAFMKHLGAAVHLPLPPKSSSSGSPSHTTASSSGKRESTRTVEESSSGGGRKRSRQKGQNPLSMKKKQKREVFRA